MKKLHGLLKEISQVTETMETDYPELYRFLDENPITISAEGHPEIGEATLRSYLESLRELLRHHIETHGS